MEINMENAFFIFMKMSLSPFVTSANAISQKIDKICYWLLVSILEKPLLSTVLFSYIMMMLLGILTISVIIMAAVFCIVIVILIFEVFIFSVILILTAVVTVISMGFAILLMGLKLIYETKVL